MADTFERGLTKLEANIFAEVENALLDIADDLASQGNRKAPLDTGHLRDMVQREAKVKIAKLKGRRFMVIGVKARTPYAAIQHEAEHFVHPRGGQAKFLTKPADERISVYQKLIKKALKTALKRSQSE